MEGRLARFEGALRRFQAHDRKISVSHMLVFLEVARAVDGVELGWIARHLETNPAKVAADIGHLGAVRGSGPHAALHSLLELRNPPKEAREQVAFLTAEGRKLAAELDRALRV